MISAYKSFCSGIYTIISDRISFAATIESLRFVLNNEKTKEPEHYATISLSILSFGMRHPAVWLNGTPFGKTATVLNFWRRIFLF